MKIIPFGNNASYGSVSKKEAETPDAVQNKEEKKLTTDGAKKILGNGFLLTAAGIFSFLAVDTIVLKRFVKNNIGPIKDIIVDDCKKAYDEALSHFNDWQKRDFIKAFNKGAEAAKDKTVFAAEKIAEVVNIANKRKVVGELPQNAVEAFDKLLSTWLGK